MNERALLTVLGIIWRSPAAQEVVALALRDWACSVEAEERRLAIKNQRCPMCGRRMKAERRGLVCAYCGSNEIGEYVG
jgi:predicted Zn-ribbon and HTH transcriptional regulator